MEGERKKESSNRWNFIYLFFFFDVKKVNVISNEIFILIVPLNCRKAIKESLMKVTGYFQYSKISQIYF